MIRARFAALFCALIFVVGIPTTAANARPKHRVKAPAVECFLFFCGADQTAHFGKEITKKPNKHGHKLAVIDRKEITHQTTVLAHPPGCPRRAFCGCGAAVHLFGKPIRSLWLARNWFKFPRTSPAPKMAAVRPHHVFILEHHISGNVWMSYDANSGGGRTRLHPRSIAGYAIVNPHGAMASRGQAL